MKRAIFLLIVLSFVPTFTVFSEPQADQPENPVQVKDNFEEEHKDKQAIFLLYDISIDLAEDYSYVRKVYNKVKILKEEAMSIVGEFPIAYTDGREKILDIKAHTITPDGKKHRYSKIQDVKMYADYSAYSDTREKIVTFSNVTVGSVLEYEFTSVTDRGPMKDAFWDAFYFIYPVPTKESYFRFSFPKSIAIHYMEFNLKYKPEITEDDTTITYSWHLKNPNRMSLC